MVTDLKDLRPDRHGRMLLRLRERVLIPAEPVSAAPGNIMCRQDTVQFIIIDRKLIVFPLYPADLFCVPIGNSKTAAFIIHKSVEAYEPKRAQVEGQLP